MAFELVTSAILPDALPTVSCKATHWEHVITYFTQNIAKDSRQNNNQ